MPSPAVTLTVDERRFNRAVQAFLRRQAPAAVDRASRRIVFGVASRCVRDITAGAVPRIDTGRYRAGWAMGTKQAIGKAPNAPLSTDPKNPSRPGDGTGTKTGAMLSVTYTVANNVEYGPLLEYGTVSMAAGLHLAHALEGEGHVVARLVGGEVLRAWEGH